MSNGRVYALRAKGICPAGFESWQWRKGFGKVYTHAHHWQGELCELASIFQHVFLNFFGRAGR